MKDIQRRDPARRWVVSGALALVLLFAGCNHSPDYSIFGSFFPVWIFCSAAGLLLAVCARFVIMRTSIAKNLVAPALLYLSLATFFACALWLLFFS